MDNQSFIIEGLGGEKTLRGTIRINGAKNAALKAMAAAVLFDAPLELQNIPDNEDVHTMTAILEKLGAKVKWDSKSEIRNPKSEGNLNIQNSNKDNEKAKPRMTIDPTKINSSTIDPKLAGVMRASVVLTGPLLARFGKVSFPAPGGCVIGARPIDQFLKGYREMGASIDEKECIYNIEINKENSANDQLTIFNLQSDITINFEKKTVGGTETLLMAAVLGSGTVTLNNCAREPEIVNVAEWLNECGADIRGVGTETIIIKGTNGKLLSPRKPYVAIPDRIEAGSYLLLGALCASELNIENCRPDHMTALIELLQKSGVPIEIESNSCISIKGNTKPNSTFSSFDVTTREYPGFPTDLQAQVVTFLTQVTGSSKVVENIFEGRFKYVSDLQKMGATISINDSHTVTVAGGAELHAPTDDENLYAHDLRAGFAVVMAALVAGGTSTVNNAYFIDRGYEKLEERLSGIGADIRRVQSR